MLVAFILFFIMFVTLAVLTFMGKLTSLFTGDKVNEEGEPVYDNKAITRFLGRVMSVLAVSALLGMLGYMIPKLQWMVIVAPILFIAVLLFALVYVNTEDRFKAKKRRRRYRR